MNSAERHNERYERRVRERETHKKKYYKNDNYDDVFRFTNLFNSHRNCRNGVRWKENVQKYKANYMLNLYNNYNALQYGSFKHGNFHEFDIVERGKERHIQSSSFSDRIIQRCLSDECLVPLLSKQFIYDNYANQKGKGISFAINRLTTHLHQYYRKYGSDGYILQFDFSKYFDSLSHEVIKRIIDENIHDIRLQKITKDFVDKYGEKGLGLGSPVSQVLALMYSNYIDHFFKEEMHIRFYGRYMDDGYIISNNKDFIWSCYYLLEVISKERGLTLNPSKTHITKLSRGFTFLKIRFNLTDTGKVVRRLSPKNITRMRRKLKSFEQKVKENKMTIEDVGNSVQSWLGYASHFHSYKSRKKIIDVYNDIKESFNK